MSATDEGTAMVSRNQYDVAQKQARLLNCSDESPAAIISCLKTKSSQEIAESRPGFAVNFQILTNEIV